MHCTFLPFAYNIFFSIPEINTRLTLILGTAATYMMYKEMKANADSLQLRTVLLQKSETNEKWEADRPSGRMISRHQNPWTLISVSLQIPWVVRNSLIFGR